MSERHYCDECRCAIDLMTPCRHMVALGYKPGVAPDAATRAGSAQGQGGDAGEPKATDKEGPDCSEIEGCDGKCCAPLTPTVEGPWKAGDFFTIEQPYPEGPREVTFRLSTRGLEIANAAYTAGHLHGQESMGDEIASLTNRLANPSQPSQEWQPEGFVIGQRVAGEWNRSSGVFSVTLDCSSFSEDFDKVPSGMVKITVESGPAPPTTESEQS